MRLHSLRGRFGAYLAPDGDPPPGGPPAGDPPAGDPPPNNNLPPNAPGWYGQLSPENREALTKGGHDFKSANDVVGKFLEYDRSMGSRVEIPGEGAKPETVAAFRKAIGVPDDPQGYEWKAPEGQQVDAQMSEWAGALFHKAGLSKGQASALNEGWNGLIAKSIADGEAAFGKMVSEGDRQLDKEWGGQAAANRDLRGRAAAHLGITKEGLDALYKTQGYVETSRALAKAGQWFLDDAQRPGGGGGFADPTTAEEAQRESDRMFADPQIRAALSDRNHPDHKQLSEKLDRLQRLRSK